MLPLDAAAPVPAPAGEESPRFYTVDTARRTAREVWWWSRGPTAPLAYLQWALRRRLLCSVDDPPVAALRPFTVAAEAVPAEVREALAPILAELAGFGFAAPRWQVIDDDLMHTQTVLATCAHPDGDAFARIHHRRCSFTAPPRVNQFVEFVSACDDDSFLWTLNTGPSFEPPPDCRTLRVPGATPAALWAAHRDRLLRERFAHAVTPLRDDAAVAAAERLHARVRDRLLARGVFRPRSDDEAQRAAALTARRAAADGAGAHADVLAEIDRLERPQTGWRKTLLVLLASIGLFLAAGAWQWSLEFAALLVPVLLFHELGHWVAMRVFRYRNLRMFFIPFFGAAVSGRHYNVPGWKKVVVSLMGPLPGIVVGTGLAAVALYTDSDLVRRLALVMVIVNGFNLAPILPLDGGWVVRALVFSRHHLLDVLFSLLAGAALLRFGAASDAPLFLILGLLFLMSALTTYRSGLIVRALRAAALPPVPDDDDRLPPSTAAVIIERVRAVWPTANARNTAQHTLRIFEALNARPPGWLASLGLGAVYLGGIALAVLALFALTTGRHLLRPYLEPRGRLDAAAIIAPPAAAFPADGHTLLIATYDDPGAARAAHAALGADPGGGAAAALFGQSVIVSTAPGAARDARAAQLPGAPALLDSTTSFAVQLSLTCHTADAAGAAALRDTLAGFFALPTAQLIPPWADPDPRTAAERARHQRARDTYRRIASERYGFAEMDALAARLDAAYARDDETAIAALSARMEALERDAAQRAIAAIQHSDSPDVDAELAAAYGAALAVDDDDDDRSADAWIPVLARLGTIADDGSAINQSVSYGSATAYETLLRVDDARFADAVHGPAALSAWLQAAGCGNQRYAFED